MTEKEQGDNNPDKKGKTNFIERHEFQPNLEFITGRMFPETDC